MPAFFDFKIRTREEIIRSVVCWALFLIVASLFLLNPVEKSDAISTVHGSLFTARAIGGAAAVLPDGKILIAGGNLFGKKISPECMKTESIFLCSAEIYDPVFGRSSSAATLPMDMPYPSATLLSDNSILWLGSGVSGLDPTYYLYETNKKEWVPGRFILKKKWDKPPSRKTLSSLYDSKIQKTIPNANHHYPKWSHSAIPLNDGNIFVYGGYGDLPKESRVMEIFDSKEYELKTVGYTKYAHHSHAAVKLPMGDILITGGDGLNNDNPKMCPPIERVDSKTFQTSIVGQLIIPRIGHSANLLENGKVLIAGGTPCGQKYTYLQAPAIEGEMYDPVSKTSQIVGKFQKITTYLMSGSGKNSLKLPNGKILFFGNAGIYPDIHTYVEVFDPTLSQFQVIGRLKYLRFGGLSYVLHPNGNVYIWGGEPEYQRNNMLEDFTEIFSGLEPVEIINTEKLK